MSDYEAVSCDLHSRLELAIMRRMPLTLRWTDEGGNVRTETVRAVDLYTREGAEWLEVAASGESPPQEATFRLRLDRFDWLS